jgi:hypothetical protein
VYYRDRENLTALGVLTHSPLARTVKVYIGWKQGTALGNGKGTVLCLQQRG